MAGSGRELTDEVLGKAIQEFCSQNKGIMASEGEAADGKKRWLLSPGDIIIQCKDGKLECPTHGVKMDLSKNILEIWDSEPDPTQEPAKPQETPRKSGSGRINAIVQRTGQVGALVKPRDLSQITPADISKMFCPEATEEEAAFFLEICLRRGLNPFAGDAFLVKYGGQNPKATTIVSKEAFFKKAEVNPQYDGIESGLILAVDDKIEEREGAFYLKGKVTILGGWAKVYRKDRKVPSIAKVSIEEFRGKSHFWIEKPGIMITKVAEVHALRKAFPNDLGGLYESAEMDIDPNKEIKQEA